MTAITIRLDDDGRQAIEDCKRATHERTASKALMRAARLYPDTLAELRRRQDQLAQAHRELDELRDAVADWTEARETEARARRAVESILTR